MLIFSLIPLWSEKKKTQDMSSLFELVETCFNTQYMACRHAMMKRMCFLQLWVGMFFRWLLCPFAYSIDQFCYFFFFLSIDVSIDESGIVKSLSFIVFELFDSIQIHQYLLHKTECPDQLHSLCLEIKIPLIDIYAYFVHVIHNVSHL